MAAPAVPVIGLQLFWAFWSIVGLVAVAWASLHVGGTRALLDELSHGWGAFTIALDLLFVAIPVVAFMVIESYRLGMRWPWIWVPLIIPLPGAFLIPLFFLLRERALLHIRAQEDLTLQERQSGGNAR
ncbi:MAG: hypothetical protein JWM91_548 [Rhodospirillales bacterium]|nr:hypothetical protein [Rhodospirillales bacterium]